MKFFSLLCLSIYLFTACTRPAKKEEGPEKILLALKDADHVKMWPAANAKLQSDHAAPADYYRAVILAAHLNKRKEGVQIIQKGLSVTRTDDPFYIPLLLLHADFYRSESNYSFAIKVLDSVLVMQPDNYTALFNRSVVAEETGDYQGAIFLYQRILTKSPQDSEVLNNLAFTCAEAGFYPHAIEYAKKGLEVVKDDRSKAFLLNNMGLAIALSGDTEGGMQKVEESLALYPDNGYAWRNKGIILIRQGNKKAACQSFATASAKGDSALVASYIREHCNQ